MNEFDVLTGTIEEVRSLLAAASPPASGDPLVVAGDGQLCEFTVAVEAAGRLLDAVRVRVAAEVADRSRHGLGSDSLAVKLGHKNARHLLETLTLVSPAEVARRIRVGSGIRPRTAPVSGAPLPAEHEVVGGAVRDGTVGVDSAGVILRCLEAAARTATPDAVLDAERALVEAAQHSGADEVAVQAGVWLAALDPDGAEPRDERIVRQRGFVLGRERDGLTPFSGHLVPTDAALLTDAFADADNPATHPRFLSDADRRTGTVFSVADDGTAEIRFLDTRTRPQRHYDVLTGLVRAGTRSTGTEPGAMRPTATVTAVITLNDLRTIIAHDRNHGGGGVPGAGVGWIDGITQPVSAETIRQMVCDAGYAAILLGDNGEILHYGRTQRYFSTAQMKAMAVRDGGCVSCGAPPAACDGHHVLTWSHDNGPTDIDNGALLCPGCHRMIHHSHHKMRITNGIPHILAPTWLDPTQTWRRLGRNRTHMLTTLHQNRAEKRSAESCEGQE
jgi:hypothetical protein